MARLMEGEMPTRMVFVPIKAEAVPIFIYIKRRQIKHHVFRFILRQIVQRFFNQFIRAFVIILPD